MTTQTISAISGRFYIATLMLFILTLPAFAAPRPPSFLLPEFAPVLHKELFNEVYEAGISNAEVVIPNYGTLRESFSGYALERAGKVSPMVIAGVDESGRTNVSGAVGAVRAWVRPYWGSSSVGGSGPGHAARLVELVAVGNGQSATVFSLQASADGNQLVLLGTGGVLLAADIVWLAGEWHQIVLNYGPGTNVSELVLDGETVATGPSTVAIAPAAAALVVCSDIGGNDAFEGEVEEVYCFKKPLKLALHYLPLKDVAAAGPISTAELQARQEKAEKWKAQKAAKAKALEESGEGEGGGMMMLMGGSSATCVTNGPVYLTNVVASISTNSGVTIWFDVMGGTNGIIYDLFSTPVLSGSNSVWTWLEPAQVCERHWFDQQPFQQCFFMVLDRNSDRDGDNLPDSWELKHFGNLAQTAAGDYDGDEVSNGAEHTNGTDPNSIYFSVSATNDHVNSSITSLQMTMFEGVPEMMAVLVDSTNFTTANWTGYTSSPGVNLGSTEGWHQVWVGLRGHLLDAPSVWRSTRIKLDTTPPLLVVTNPASSVVAKPVLQLRGYCPEALTDFTYDLTNSAGLDINRQAFVLEQRFETNTWEFTTNWFQCFDLPLADGTNVLTFHATDLAGNVTTTNLILVRDYSGKTNPPVVRLDWPKEGTRISGDSFTARGWLADPTAQVTAQIVGTNGVTNVVTGRVGRDGDFWIENLPLEAGTNSLTIIATDVATNFVTTNINVIKSGVTITASPMALGLGASGTISDINYAVWVNGARATVNGDGTWGVAPRFALNNANAQVRAIPNSDNGGNGSGGSVGGDNPSSSQSVDIEAKLSWPDAITYATSLNIADQLTYRTTNGTAYYATDFDVNWGERAGGSIVSSIADDSSTNLWNYSLEAGRWPELVDGVVTLTTFLPSGSVTSTSSFTNEMGLLGNAGGGQAYIGHLEFDVFGGTYAASFNYQAELTLVTGGDPGSGELNLYEIWGGAEGLSTPTNPVTLQLPGGPIAPEKIRVGALGNLDANGVLYAALPPRTAVSVTPSVPSEFAYVGIAGKQYEWISQCIATTPTNQARRTVGVGEQVNLRWNPPLQVLTNYSISGGGSLAPIMADNSVWRFTAPSNAATVTITFKHQKAVMTKTFTVLEPTGIHHAQIIATNHYSAGTAGAGMTVKAWVAPTNVSFYRVSILEIGIVSTNATGYFANTNVWPANYLDHSQYGADIWFPPLTVDNTFIDYAYSGPCTPPVSEGNFTWPNPVVWQIGTAIPATNRPIAWYQDQEFLMNSSGAVTIRKFGRSVTRTTNNVITTQ